MNELDLLRRGRPADTLLSDQAISAARRELARTMGSSVGPSVVVDAPWHRSRSLQATALLGCAFAIAAASWAVLSGGRNLDDPAFTGDTWQLIVGEGSNGDGTFKVCRSFFPPDSREIGLDSAMGDSGCEVSPIGTPNQAITAIIPALATRSEIVLFVDLTKLPVAEVVIETDTGEAQSITPFVMPQSREQVAAAEIPDTSRTVSVAAYDEQGNLLQTETIEDPQPTQ